MPLTPFPVTQFGGLDLTSDPTELGPGAAVDAMNVAMTHPGRFDVRDGLTSFLAPGSPVIAMAMHGTAGQVLVSLQTAVIAYNSAGTQLAFQATVGVGGFAQLSTSGFATATFMPATTGTPKKWDGAAFSNSAWANSTQQRVAVTPDFRVAYTGDGNTGVAGAPSKDAVYFSDPGVGDAYTTNNFVVLSRADGERLVDIVTWRELMFAFKQNKFYVFTGNSTDGGGNPVFNFRTVAGIGAVDPGRALNDANPRVAAAGPDGVYFLASDGVYVTNGGAPVRISRPLDAWFRNETLPFTTAIPSNIGFTDACLGVVANRVYVCPNPSQSLTFVYEIATQTWTAYSWAMAAICPYAVGNAIPIPLIAIGSTVYKHTPAATTDNGVAIAWSYRTGYSNAGGYFRQRIVSSGERKKHFKTDILGSGTVTHQVLALNARPNDVADTGASVTLGTSPAIARGSRRRGVRGTHFAHKLSGSGPASINGLTYWLSEISLDT